jgi:hypothetical protein
MWTKFIPYNQASFVADLTEAWFILVRDTVNEWRGKRD